MNKAMLLAVSLGASVPVLLPDRGWSLATSTAMADTQDHRKGANPDPPVPSGAPTEASASISSDPITPSAASRQSPVNSQKPTESLTATSDGGLEGSGPTTSASLSTTTASNSKPKATAPDEDPASGKLAQREKSGSDPCEPQTSQDEKKNDRAAQDDSVCVRLPKSDALGAGLTYWAALGVMSEWTSATGGKPWGARLGGSFHINIGPMVWEPYLAVPIQIGYSGAANTSHVEVSLMPTLFKESGKTKLHLGVLGGLAGSTYDGAACNKDVRCGTRFQYMAGLEFGWFPFSAEPKKTDDLTKRAVEELVEYLEDYRRACPTNVGGDAACQRMVQEIRIRIDALHSPDVAKRQCVVPKSHRRDNNGQAYYNDDDIHQLSLCPWAMRQDVDIADAMRFGFVVRYSYIVGRALPSANRAELGLSVSF